MPVVVRSSCARFRMRRARASPPGRGCGSGEAGVRVDHLHDAGGGVRKLAHRRDVAPPVRGQLEISAWRAGAVRAKGCASGAAFPAHGVGGRAAPKRLREGGLRIRVFIAAPTLS